jgi:hypothetical protein
MVVGERGGLGTDAWGPMTYLSMLSMPAVRTGVRVRRGPCAPRVESLEQA